MITLVRWILLKQKEIKYKLAFYTLLDKTVKEQKEQIAEFAHTTAQAEKNKAE